MRPRPLYDARPHVLHRRLARHSERLSGGAVVCAKKRILKSGETGGGHGALGRRAVAHHEQRAAPTTTTCSRCGPNQRDASVPGDRAGQVLDRRGCDPKAHDVLRVSLRPEDRRGACSTSKATPATTLTCCEAQTEQRRVGLEGERSDLDEFKQRRSSSVARRRVVPDRPTSSTRSSGWCRSATSSARYDCARRNSRRRRRASCG